MLGCVRLQGSIKKRSLLFIFFWKEQDRSILFGLPGSRQQKFLVLRFFDVKEEQGIDRNMGFNESGEYMKTFIGFGVGTGSMQVLQGDEFEVEPQDGYTFEGATLSMGTIQYREDNNEAAFAVAAVEKIYAHESLTFNNTVACEVISKWKAGLKDDMDARSDVPGFTMKSWYRLLLKGQSTLSLEGSLSGDCDVENNDVAAYITLTGAWKKEIWLNGLLAESGYELSLVAGIATGALVNGGSRSEILYKKAVIRLNGFFNLKGLVAGKCIRRIGRSSMDTAYPCRKSSIDDDGFLDALSFDSSNVDMPWLICALGMDAIGIVVQAKKVLALLVQYGLSKVRIRRIEGLEWIRRIHFHGYGISMSAVSLQSSFSRKNKTARS
ncbi:hypothetical protein Tco_0662998 [Tanacetum coccineum]